MSDRYEALRKALGDLHGSGRWDSRETRVYFGDGGFDLRNAPHPTERVAYIAAANPDTIRELLRERDALAREVNEQARLNGMGSEREARLMAERDELRRERDALLGLLSRIDAAISQEKEEGK